MNETCSWYESKMDDFFADRLTNEEMERFLAHGKQCEACQEELSIRFLIGEGMEIIDAGESFHLDNELAARQEEAGVRLQKRKRLEGTAVRMEILAVVAVALAFAGVLLWR